MLFSKRLESCAEQRGNRLTSPPTGVVIGYWDAASSVNIAVYITIVIVLYCALNLWDARVSSAFVVRHLEVTEGSQNALDSSTPTQNLLQLWERSSSVRLCLAVELKSSWLIPALSVRSYWLAALHVHVDGGR